MGMPKGKPLPTRAGLVGRKLLRMALSSTSELAGDIGASPRQAERGIQDLQRAGFSDSAEIGVVLPPVTRHWLTEAGLTYFGASDEEGSWHRLDGLGNLWLFDPAKVEAVHAVARRYAKRGWSLTGVQFFERQPMIARVEYTHPDEPMLAYLTIVWASMLDTEAMLYGRLDAIPQAMQEQLEGSPPFRPDGLALVGDGEWGASKALYMAHATLIAWVSPDRITGWYYGDNRWRVSDADSVTWGTPLVELPRLSGRMKPLRSTMSVRRLGRRSLEGVLAPYRHVGRAWPKLLQLLTMVGIYPVGSVAHYQDLAGESPKGTATKERMRLLQDLGLVRVVTKNGRAKAPTRSPAGVPVTLSERGQGGHRYITTKRGRVFICYAHGGKPGDLAGRTKLGRLWAKRKKDGKIIDIIDKWPYRHEDILFEVLGQLARRRCPFGPGWQARTTLADGKRIDPDAVILVETLWDRGWCYLEIELSDRTYLAIQPRGAKYASVHRRDEFPVLVVCPTDTAERNWHIAGQEFDQPPRLLTTTLGRLKKGGGVFGPGVWSCYGRAETIYPAYPGQ